MSLPAPDTGICIGELDQAAAVGVGIITLGITIYEVSNDIPPVARLIRKYKIRLGLLREARDDELPLTGYTEEGQSEQSEAV